MLSALAELQRELIVANTNDGLASARARGRVGGTRPRSPNGSQRAEEKPSSRSPTCLACPARLCTATSTRPRPSPASPRRPQSRTPDLYLAAGVID
ncbi:hypothetical protein ACFYW6_39940 [Streptomyces sp. NPDC002659]|uniref:hypothetical protein n=1 Tax=Streptomyces sp. NPDC002659 TaxID=3364656 RepID=UPI0036C9C50E